MSEISSYWAWRPRKPPIILSKWDQPTGSWSHSAKRGQHRKQTEEGKDSIIPTNVCEIYDDKIQNIIFLKWSYNNSDHLHKTIETRIWKLRASFMNHWSKFDMLTMETHYTFWLVTFSSKIWCIYQCDYNCWLFLNV